jgi:hypothetical protein
VLLFAFYQLNSYNGGGIRVLVGCQLVDIKTFFIKFKLPRLAGSLEEAFS